MRNKQIGLNGVPKQDAQMGISLAEVLSYFIHNLKWLILLFILVFVTLGYKELKASRMITYQQVVQIPTVINTTTLKHENLISIQSMQSLFYANYLLEWRHSSHYQQMTNTLLKDSRFMSSSSGGVQMPVGSLLLSIKASSADKKEVQVMFHKVISALNIIFNQQIAQWQTALKQKIKTTKKKIVSLTGAMQKVEFGNSDKMGGNEVAKAIVISRLQGEIVPIQQTLQNYQWQLSSVNMVMHSSKLFCSRQVSTFRVALKTFFLSVLCVLVLGFFLSLLGFGRPPKKESAR